ncbi:MAG: hypothetical protein EXS16_15985 [Gemmataceae bacterium]|nr:hypothetical protein [Gemmataceae bacterium]
MRKGKWIALAAVGLMLAGGGAVWANDTVRLGGPQAQAEITGGTNTELVHRGRGGYNRGGYGGSYYGGGYGGGGYYGGGYRSGYYSPYAYNSYYSRSYYSSSSYYPRSYYSQSYYSPYYSSYYYPCAGEEAPTVALQATSRSTLLAPPQGYTPPPVRNVPPMPPAGDGSFRYDGEPRNIVPMPAPVNVDPVKGPQRLVPLDGKLVSFGGVSPIPTPNPRNIVGSTASSTVRISYPAYGEEPIAPVRRK